MIDRYIPKSPFWRGMVSVSMAMGAIGAIIGFAFLITFHPVVWAIVLGVGVIFVVSTGFYDFLTTQKRNSEFKDWWENRWNSLKAGGKTGGTDD